jgi:hypothetical protein
VLRGLLLLTSSAFGFYALQHLPVAEFTAIVMLTPVMVTLLAAWLLKEAVSPLRWALVAAAFTGTLIVVRPGSDLFGWAVLLPLGNATAYALFQLLTRRLAGHKRDPSPPGTSTPALRQAPATGMAIAGARRSCWPAWPTLRRIGPSVRTPCRTVFRSPPRQPAAAAAEAGGADPRQRAASPPCPPIPATHWCATWTTRPRQTSLRRIRQVDDKHHLTLLCRDLSELASYARVDNRQYRLLKLGTPGPYTFILEATKEVPRRVSHPSRAPLACACPTTRACSCCWPCTAQPLLATTLIRRAKPTAERPRGDPRAL